MPEVTPLATGRIDHGPHELHWELHGDGGRETICLLNGLAMHCPAWYGFLDRLTPTHDVLLWDYPGQGRSTKHDLPLTFPELADGQAAILDAAGLDRVHLVGISYGGFVALETARLHHDRLATMVLSGILLFEEELFEMYEALSLRFYRGDRDDFELYTRYMYEKIFGEEFVRRLGGREALEPMRERFFDRYVDSRHALIRLTEAQDPHFAAVPERIDEYRSIPTPTRILAGEHDRAIPTWMQAKIASVLPNVRYDEIPGCGHVCYLESPDAFFGATVRLATTGSLA